MKRLLLSFLLLATSLGGMAQRPGGTSTLAAPGGGGTPLPSGPNLYEPAITGFADAINTVFQSVDKSRVSSGILEEYGLQFIDHTPFTGANGFTAAKPAFPFTLFPFAHEQARAPAGPGPAHAGRPGCHKKDPTPDPPADPRSQLPPETQTGQRTFGCLLNGQPWTQAGSSFGGPLLTAQYFNQQLTVSANRSTTVDGTRIAQGIQINISKLQSAGKYTLVDSVNDFVNVVDLVTHCAFYTNPRHPATVDITRLDPVARIVSGRFSFALETPGCGKVTGTDGRFDCPF